MGKIVSINDKGFGVLFLAAPDTPLFNSTISISEEVLREWGPRALRPGTVVYMDHGEDAHTKCLELSYDHKLFQERTISSILGLVQATNYLDQPKTPGLETADWQGVGLYCLVQFAQRSILELQAFQKHITTKLSIIGEVKDNKVTSFRSGAISLSLDNLASLGSVAIHPRDL